MKKVVSDPSEFNVYEQRACSSIVVQGYDRVTQDSSGAQEVGKAEQGVGGVVEEVCERIRGS